MRRRAAVPALLFLLAGCGSEGSGDLVRVTIPRGADLSAIADTLEAYGVIDSPARFRLYAFVTGRQGKIPAGTYDLPRGASARHALRALLQARVAEARLVVPEGSMLTELAAAVETQLGVPADSVLGAARDPALLASLGIATGTLEGFLYPSTYLVPVDARAIDVVRQMVATFRQQWQPDWDGRLATLGMTQYQIVTLASIIEGEVRDSLDRAYVSSVYHNRLNRGMRLQADPTVIYALGRRRRLYERDYQTRSPHNTYLIDGLPPTPIGQPSAASIVAALYPARTDFLYFVARGDGRHVFSRTLREHLRTIAEIRQGTAPPVRQPPGASPPRQ